MTVDFVPPGAVDILTGDALAVLADLPPGSFQTCVTSPPYYGLRDYGVSGQIGLEPTPDVYVARLVEVFRAVRRVLRPDGTLWLNLGDSYAGSWGNQGRKAERGTQRPINGPMLTPVHDGRYGDRGSRTGAIPPGADYKAKDLLMIPAQVALALRADGWWLRSDIIWHKPNPMPESTRDRPTCAHEHVFLLAKSERYYFDAAAIAEPAVSDHPSGNGFKREARVTYKDAKGARGGTEQWTGVGGTRNARNVQTIATRPYKGAHFATMPPALAAWCIKAGSKPGDRVLDPFGGVGTTALAAMRLDRRSTLIELSPASVTLAQARLSAETLPLPGVVA